MIDRYLLRYFLAVIDYGNFTRAAESCNVTQPTLSVGIARLESLVGQPLFNRTNRRVDLTATGARFAIHARQIEGQFNLAEQVGLADGPRQRFRLGIVNTLPLGMLRCIIERLSRWQAGQVEIVEGRERDLLERLGAARIDAALSIVRPQQHRYRSDPLFTEGYGLALPDAHPLAGESTIAAESLSENVMIVRRQCELLSETSQHFTKRGVRPFFAARTMNDDRAMAYVAAGLGVTIMPDCFRGPGITRVPMAEFDYVRTIGLLHRLAAEETHIISGHIASALDDYLAAAD